MTSSETFVNALFFDQLNLHTVISRFFLILSECSGFNTSSNNNICFIILITIENNFDFSSFSLLIFAKKSLQFVVAVFKKKNSVYIKTLSQCNCLDIFVFVIITSMTQMLSILKLRNPEYSFTQNYRPQSLFLNSNFFQFCCTKMLLNMSINILYYILYYSILFVACFSILSYSLYFFLSCHS